MAARVAGHRERLHGVIVALVLLTGPAIVAGASIRAAAARGTIQPHTP